MPKLLRVFMSAREARNLIEVIEEEFEHGVIYWFHWPYDGPRPFSHRENYEPIAVIGGGAKLAARPHFTLVWTDDVMRIGGAPVVVFLTSWHQPVIHGPEIDMAFRALRGRLVEVDYRPRRGGVPEWFRDAGLGIDFRDYAVEVSRDPLNKGFDVISSVLADYVEIAERVDEALKLLENGELEKSLDVCRWIVGELRGKIFSDLMRMLIEPYIVHIDEYGLPQGEEARRELIDYLKEDLGYVKIMLNTLLGRE